MKALSPVPPQLEKLEAQFGLTSFESHRSGSSNGAALPVVPATQEAKLEDQLSESRPMVLRFPNAATFFNTVSQLFHCYFITKFAAVINYNVKYLIYHQFLN